MKMICKLSDILKAQGLTQADLAKSAGIRPATVGKLAGNRFTSIHVETVEKIMEALEINDFGDLFKMVD